MASTTVFTGLTSWRWPLVVSLLITGLLEIPHWIALAQASRGMAFVGMFWSAHDVSQYLAAMREGAAGAWLIRDHLSGEPHDPALMYGLYVLLGKVTPLLGADFERTYIAAGSVGRFLLLLAVYAATGLVTARDGKRRLAFCLVVFGSGLTALLGIGAGIAGVTLNTAATDLNQVEVSTFLALFTAPHLMIGLALSLGIARTVALAWDGSKPAATAAIVMSVVLGIVNPFSLATMCAVLCTYMTVQVARRQLSAVGMVGAAGVIVASAPFLLYSLLGFMADPFWGSTYGRQNRTLTDPPIELLLGLGLQVPLALLGAYTFRRQLTVGRLLVLTWIAVAVTLMYLPVGFQRRFTFGLHPMLALVAAIGLGPIWTWLRRDRPFPGVVARPFGTALLATTLFGSTLFLYTMCLIGATAPARVVSGTGDPNADHPTFQPTSLRRAADWLAQRSGADDVVLGHTASGNLVAGIIPGRAYVGHWVATLDFQRKQRDVSWFYAQPLDDERLRFLRDRGIRYIVYGPHERALGAVRPDEVTPGLAGDRPHGATSLGITLWPAYDRDGVAILEVSTTNGWER